MTFLSVGGRSSQGYDLLMPDEWAAQLEKVLRGAHLPVREIEGRAAAVLLPIVATPEPSLIFTLRTDTLPSHKGQISFPGGSIDPDDPTAEFAALREAHEEIGIEPGDVTVLGELETFPTFVSGYVVTPVVGWLEEMPELNVNAGEVAEVLVVPIADLTEAIRREPGFEHGGRTFPTEAWVWNDKVIWGVTALILRFFLERLAEAGLVDPPTQTTAWDFPPPPGVTESSFPS
jgi:8-oxo-dGTP pyrophosphatase MutT (NUDIX family)